MGLRALLDKGDGSGALSLVDEMTSQGCALAPDLLKLVVDASLSDEMPDEFFLEALSSCRANGACRAFGSVAVGVRPEASAEALPQAPTDERDAEIGGAAAASLLAAGTALMAGPIAAFGLAASAWAGDRYTQQGRGFESLSRGLTRLDQGPMASDLRRDSAVESAAFLAGYLLGLPCCIAAPGVDPPIAMIADSASDIDRLLAGAAVGGGASAALLPPALRRAAGGGGGGYGGAPPRLIDRSLVWLMAPVAAEQAGFDEVRVSNPGLAAAFLQAARRREASLGVDVQQGGWATPADDELRVRWAYEEARTLMRRYAGLRTALQERMESGMTVGDGVALIEEWL